MGKIEEIIFANYKHAMENGDYEQAKKAIELATVLKSKTDMEGFMDYDSIKAPTSLILGQFFNPFPYKHNYKDSVVQLESTAIKLTKTENKLFFLFSQNETFGTDVKVISKNDIKEYLWRSEEVVQSAVRISVMRLRSKIEADPKNPRVIINHHSHGYIFLGKKVDRF